MIFIFIICIVFVLATTIGYEQLKHRDKLFMLFGWPFLGVVILRLGYTILFEFNQVSIYQDKITIKNLVSKQTKEIAISGLKGFKDKFSNGYTILLIDSSDKVVARISDLYYKDFISFRNMLELKYLGRVNTFWSRIIRVAENDTD